MSDPIICSVCKDKRTHAYIIVKDVPVCTDCTMVIHQLATHLGLIEVKKLLIDHHMRSALKVSPIAGKQEDQCGHSYGQ